MIEFDAPALDNIKFERYNDCWGGWIRIQSVFHIFVTECLIDLTNYDTFLEVCLKYIFPSEKAFSPSEGARFKSQHSNSSFSFLFCVVCYIVSFYLAIHL